MCTYTRTVFECSHQVWGRRLKLCTVGEDYRHGQLPSDCAFRKPHGLHSRRISRRCDKCEALDRKRSLLRAKLDECKEAFGKTRPGKGTGTDTGEAERQGYGSDAMDKEGTVGAEDGDGHGGSVSC